MAKHLTRIDVAAIVNIILGWNDEKFTWESICLAASKIIGKNPTRQSLSSNLQIKHAYAQRKSGLKVNGASISTPGSLKIAADRLSRQQNEIENLKDINSKMMEQFVKWQYNSYKHGVKEHQLNAPMPQIDRERTEKK